MSTLFVNHVSLAFYVGTIIFLFFSFTVVFLLQFARQKMIALRAEVRENLILHELGARLCAERTTEKLIKSVTDAATTLIEAEIAAFFYQSTENGETKMKHVLSGGSQKERNFFASLPQIQHACLLGCSLIEGKLLKSDDITQHPDYGKNGPYFGMPQGHFPVKSYISAPVVSRKGTILGALFLGHKKIGKFNDHHERLVTALAAQTGIAIDNANLHEEIVEAKETAESASAAKDRFLAILSHELRTPLAPVMAGISMLQSDTSLSRPVQDELKVILRNVELEARLVNDILDVSRLTRGKLHLYIETVDLHTKLSNLIEAWENEAKRKNIRIISDFKAKEPHVKGDKQRLNQVFLNLLTNAIKFTLQDGTITISTRNKNGTIHVEMKDTGIGIASEEMPRLFTEFEQGTNIIGSGSGGLGLGLSICKSIISKHNGEIVARSEGRNRGATFEVIMKTTPREALAASLPPEPPKQEKTRSAKILLLEDHADTRRAMSKILKINGHTTETAETIAEAYSLLIKNDYDLFISDLGLPDGSGHDLMKRIKQVKPALKAIALSGFGQEDDIRKSRMVGFAIHVTKPVTMDSLTTAINQVLTVPSILQKINS